jgi:hypothetical protein
LSHQKRRGGRDFVSKADLRDAEAPAKQIGLAAQIEQRRQAGCPQRSPGRAQPPRSSETVVDHDSDLALESLRDRAAQVLRRRVGILR